MPMDEENWEKEVERLERELAAMTAVAEAFKMQCAKQLDRVELAERQVGRLEAALQNAAARLHTANTVGAFESGDDLSGYLAEGYQNAHKALEEVAGKQTGGQP